MSKVVALALTLDSSLITIVHPHTNPGVEDKEEGL